MQRQKLEERGFLRKIISNSPWSYPTNYKIYIALWKEKKSKKEIKGRKKGGRKERKEEKEDADIAWITEILGRKI